MVPIASGKLMVPFPRESTTYPKFLSKFTPLPLEAVLGNLLVPITHGNLLVPLFRKVQERIPNYFLRHGKPFYHHVPWQVVSGLSGFVSKVFIGVFAADRYTYRGSVVDKLASLRRLLKDHSRFKREIVTIIEARLRVATASSRRSLSAQCSNFG